MDERRDRTVRIDLQIFGRVLIEVQKIEIMALERHALLHECEHRLAGVGVRLPVIEREHKVIIQTASENGRRTLPAALLIMKAKRANSECVEKMLFHRLDSPLSP